MDLKNMKKSLFGFSKKDVCEYIAQLNDEFSKALNEEKEKEKNVLSEMQSNIDMLEVQNKLLETEKKEMESTVYNMSEENLMLHKTNEEICRKNDERNIELQNRLDKHKKDVDKMHECIIGILKRLDDSFVRTSHEISDIQKQLVAKEDE